MVRSVNKSYYHFFVEKKVNEDHTISKYFKTSQQITDWFGIPKSSLYNIIAQGDDYTGKYRGIRVERCHKPVFTIKRINYTDNNIC